MGKKTIYKSEVGKEKIESHYQQYLETFPFEVESRYVTTSFGKTHLLVAGPAHGQPLIVLQGGNCINPMTLSWFLPLASEYRIYAPDTIGHPGYSDQTRMSAKDDSFATWIKELMDQLELGSAAFIGPSYGGGIILRLATYLPAKIDCAVLMAPAGLQLGSKLTMIKDVLVPLLMYKITSSPKHLHNMTANMSANRMKDMDKQIIGDIFKYVKLEQDMPKLTEKRELENYHAPTLVISGTQDVFFPEKKLKKTAEQVIPNLVGFNTYDMGHFPSQQDLVTINNEIKRFLTQHYRWEGDTLSQV